MLKVAITACLFVFAACDDRSRAPKRSTYEVEGSSSERVSRVSAILEKHRSPPTAILDAHFVEERLGDGVLGPSDFRSFYLVQVMPQDVELWTKILTPLVVAAEYDGPSQPRAWWITRDAYASLQFYQPDPLTGRIHGWIGASQQTGRIYVFTFTM